MRHYVVDRHQTWDVMADGPAHAIELARASHPDTDELTTTLLAPPKVELRSFGGATQLVGGDHAGPTSSTVLPPRP